MYQSCEKLAIKCVKISFLIQGVFMESSQALNLGIFIKKSCFFAFSALLLSACAQKFNDLPNTRVLKTCQNPIATYHLIGLRNGDYNDLTIPNTQIREMVENSLAQSGCFNRVAQITADEVAKNRHYQLEVVSGNINTQEKQGDLFHTQTSDEAIFEVQLSFSRANEVRTFRGKSSIQNRNSQYFIFGDKAKLNPNQIQITLQNAINAAINEATLHLIQVQNTDFINYSNY